ncbi:helix-turn-helix transcriptional regulator [Actinoplanes sp. CA-054009]
MRTVELDGPDAVRAFLARAYGPLGMRGADQVRLRHRRIDAAGFALDTLEQSATLDFRVEPRRAVIITRMVTARLHRACAGSDQLYQPGDLFLGSYPDRSHTSRLWPGLMTNCVIDPTLIAAVAATAPGRRPGPIRFLSLAARTPEAAAHWWATRCYVADLLDNPFAGSSPLLVANAAHLLATTTVTTFPNTALTDPTIEDRHDATPAVLRRAVTYIDRHAADPITVAEIAAAANVSIRSLQLAFRRHLETTPMAYVQRVRLDHAHHALLRADPTDTTVATIAARWGFGSHGRFAATYRRTYGVMPRTTLGLPDGALPALPRAGP